MVSAHRRCPFQDEFSGPMSHVMRIFLNWPALQQGLRLCAMLGTALFCWTEFAVFIKAPFTLKPCRFSILKQEQLFIHMCRHRPAGTAVCHSSYVVTEPPVR